MCQCFDVMHHNQLAYTDKIRATWCCPQPKWKAIQFHISIVDKKYPLPKTVIRYYIKKYSPTNLDTVDCS